MAPSRFVQWPGSQPCCANTNAKFPRQCLGSTPKGFAHSTPIRCRCIYCIHQHGGGSNIIWPIPWTLSCLKLSSRLLEVKFKKCWCLCQHGSVCLGVGNFKLHLSQCIRLWKPDILGSNICMFHPTSDDDGKFVARTCCKNETCVSIFKYRWRIRTSRWGSLMPWSCYFPQAPQWGGSGQCPSRNKHRQLNLYYSFLNSVTLSPTKLSHEICIFAHTHISVGARRYFFSWTKQGSSRVGKFEISVIVNIWHTLNQWKSKRTWTPSAFSISFLSIWDLQETSNNKMSAFKSACAHAGHLVFNYATIFWAQSCCPACFFAWYEHIWIHSSMFRQYLGSSQRGCPVHCHWLMHLFQSFFKLPSGTCLQYSSI